MREGRSGRKDRLKFVSPGSVDIFLFSGSNKIWQVFEDEFSGVPQH